MTAFAWADLGLRAFGALTSGSNARAAARAQREVIAAQNQQRLAEAGLDAYIRQLNNQRRMQAFEGEDTALVTNAVRAREAFSSGQFEQGLRFSEQQGALAARAAASGVGGASVDAVAQTLDLQQARLEQQQLEGFEQSQYDTLVQRAGLAQSAITGLDSSITRVNLDNRNPRGPGTIASLVSGLGGILMDKDGRASLQVALGSLYSNQPKTQEQAQRESGLNLKFDYSIAPPRI